MNSQNHIQMYLKYTELFYPEYYHDILLKQPYGLKILEIARSRLPVKFQKEPQVHREIDNIMRSSLKWKIAKDTFLFDGLLECDFLVYVNEKPVLIEYFGPTHYLGNTNKFTGTTQLIIDMKRKIYPLIVIPYYEWRDLSPSEKSEYLVRKVTKILE
jgi:hypothetical protein